MSLLMMSLFKQAKLIGTAQKAKIDRMSDRDAAMYILDDIIIKSLQVDVPDKLDTFVKVLIEFEDDDTAVALGRQLMERLPPDSLTRIQQKLSGEQPQGGPPPGGFYQQGYPQQAGYQQPAYSQPGYPNLAGYPPQQPGYPPQQPGYPGYPPQQPGYPPQQPYTDYFPGPPMPGKMCMFCIPYSCLEIFCEEKISKLSPKLNH